jgi:phospholipid N-methyltransferase
VTRSQPSGVITFVEQAIRNYRVTGAVLPSSRRLAKVMTRPARTTTGPKRILEVGAGTGSFTEPLLTCLRPGDALHVVEVNDDFCRRLESQHLAPFRRAHPAIEVALHCAPIQDAPLHGRFDFIVCGLPFNNFPLRVVRTIFQAMLARLAPDGELTYFEYVGMRAIKAPLVGSTGRRALRRRGAQQAVFLRRHRGRRNLVIANVPPAYAVHLHA